MAYHCGRHEFSIFSRVSSMRWSSWEKTEIHWIAFILEQVLQILNRFLVKFHIKPPFCDHLQKSHVPNLHSCLQGLLQRRAASWTLTIVSFLCIHAVFHRLSALIRFRMAATCFFMGLLFLFTVYIASSFLVMRLMRRLW